MLYDFKNTDGNTMLSSLVQVFQFIMSIQCIHELESIQPPINEKDF